MARRWVIRFFSWWLLDRADLTFCAQFFITTAITNWLDGRHVVFGEVLEGYDEVVDKIQNVAKGTGDKPKVEVKIAKSGELELSESEKEGIHAEL